MTVYLGPHPCESASEQSLKVYRPRVMWTGKSQRHLQGFSYPQRKPVNTFPGPDHGGIIPKNHPWGGTMIGGIYGLGRCPVCNSTFNHFENRGIWCPNHPAILPRKVQVRFKAITRRFDHYWPAYKFLIGLRALVDKEGENLDLRDYRIKDKPLSFRNLGERWLEIKAREVEKRSWNNLKNYLSRAVDRWGDRNVKTISFGDIQDFLMDQKVSDKTRYNIRSALNDFFNWLEERQVIRPEQMPKIPRVKYELGWRRTIGKAIQETILEEVKRISWDLNPKIFSRHKVAYCLRSP